MKIALFVDDKYDAMLFHMAHWLGLGSKDIHNEDIDGLRRLVSEEKTDLQFGVTDNVTEFADMALNADCTVIDGGALRGNGDEFLDRTPSVLKTIMQRNPKTKFVITSGLPISYYHDWLKENSDLTNVAYIDLEHMSYAIGELVSGDATFLNRFFDY